jgi:hypothetical protein
MEEEVGRTWSHVGKMRSWYILIGKLKGKRPLGRTGHR